MIRDERSDQQRDAGPNSERAHVDESGLPREEEGRSRSSFLHHVPETTTSMSCLKRIGHVVEIYSQLVASVSPDHVLFSQLLGHLRAAIRV